MRATFKTALAAAAAMFGCALGPSTAHADDYAWLQGILQHCYAGHGPCAVSFNGATHTLSTPITVIPNLVTIRDLRLNCQMSSGPCINVSMDNAEATTNRSGPQSLENVTLVGNGSADGIIMSYNGNNPNINAVIALNHVRITGFNHALTLGSGTWGGMFTDMIIGNNKTGLYFPPNNRNAGERHTFTGTIYNNQIGLDEESSTEIDFNGVSFDFNGTQMILNGPTNFIGHLENGVSNKPVIALHALQGVIAGSIYFSPGSTITVDGNSPGHPPAKCFVSTVVPWNNIQVPATTWGFVGANNNPVCGPGAVYSFGAKVNPTAVNY